MAPAAILPPHAAPRRPQLVLPPGAWDCHCHVFGPASRFPLAADRPYEPPDLPLERLQALHAGLGVSKALVVATKAHGFDSRIVLDAVARSGGRYRGVVNLPPGMKDAELMRLRDGGIVGARYSFLPRLGALPDMREVRQTAERISTLDWHLSLYLPASLIGRFRGDLMALGLPYVIEHMGVVQAAAGIDQPAFHDLTDLLEADANAFVKLSGPERLTGGGPPYAEAVPFARRLMEIAPDRVIWGSDWPHPNVTAMPDDGDLVDFTAAYATDPEDRQRLLVHNPARLLGLPTPG
jgi:predicted TIM-barrel fold metal-dependent hydrolase